MAYVIMGYPRWGWIDDDEMRKQPLKEWEKQMILNPAMPWKDEWRGDLPIKAEMEPTNEPMTHWITYEEIGVTSAVREAIEALEPGIHQYHPCIVEDGGRAYEYYTLKVNQSVGDEAWDKGKTKISSAYKFEQPGWWAPELVDDPHPIMRREAIAGKHLYYYRSRLVLSNELHHRLDMAGLLTGLELLFCEED